MNSRNTCVRSRITWPLRRNFYELATPGPAPIASEALKHIAEFYAIEKDIRGRSAEERRVIRQQKSRPLADTFEQWLRTKLGLISQKGKLAEAIRYALSRWEGLTRFIDDGCIEIDNNAVERSIDVRMDDTILAEIVTFLREEKVQSVAMTEGILGCRHEEGIDYPDGESCPDCGYCAGRDRWTGKLDVN
jgi:hypothetical protein